MEEMGRLLMVLTATCVILYGCYLFTRIMAKRMQPGMGRKSGRMKVLDYVPLGTDKSLAIIQTGTRYLLVGITSDAITLLTELSPEDALLPPQEAAQAEGNGFSELLRQSVEKYRRKKDEE